MDTSVLQEEYERVVKRIRKLEDEDDTAEADMKKVLREELVELRKKENWLRDLLYPRGTATLFADCICVSPRYCHPVCRMHMRILSEASITCHGTIVSSISNLSGIHSCLL
jgi:hypothetical protein